MTTTSSDISRFAQLFHALSDETRVRVVDMLVTGEKCVCDLQDAVGAAQSRLSFHLKVLREAGIVNDRKRGRWNFYSLRPEVFDELSAFLQARKPDESAWSDCGCEDSDTGCCCDQASPF